MPRFLCLLMLISLAIPALAPAESLAPELRENSQSLDARFWNVLKSRPMEHASLSYTAGFVQGYEYALELIRAALDAQELDYNKNEMIKFIAVQKFPPKFTNSQIEELIGVFYADKQNRRLPLFVAFTYARQILSGYPEAYSRMYIEDMRRKYLKP